MQFLVHRDNFFESHHLAGACAVGGDVGDGVGLFFCHGEGAQTQNSQDSQEQTKELLHGITSLSFVNFVENSQLTLILYEIKSADTTENILVNRKIF